MEVAWRVLHPLTGQCGLEIDVARPESRETAPKNRFAIASRPARLAVRMRRAFSSKLRQERGLETLRGYAAFLRARWMWMKGSYQPSRVRGMPAFPPTLFIDSVW